MMRSRIAAALTLVALLAGAGGAIALGEAGATGGPLGGAASAQYKPGKGCGDKNHKHSGKCPSPKKKKPKKPKPAGGSKGHKHGTSKLTEKRKSQKKKNKKTVKTRWANCTLTQQGSVLVAYCP